MRTPNSVYLVLNIFILCCSITVVHCISCSNDAGSCSIITGYRQLCQISSTDTNLIQGLLEMCLSNYYDTLILEILSGAEGATLTVNNLPDNFGVLEITNRNSEKCNVQTDTVNGIISDIYFNKGPVYVMQNDFFSYFPNLQYVYLDYLVCDSIPIMANNPLLNDFEVYQATILNESSRVLDKSILGGLNYLENFYWENGGLTRVERDAFEGVRPIYTISLVGNEIRELYDCTFEGKDYLINLYLSNNGITTVGPYAFLGFDNMYKLYIAGNPEFPLSTLTTIKHIDQMHINGHSGNGLTAELIAQFSELNNLGLSGVMLNCTCEYQWIAILGTGSTIRIYTNQDSLCIGTELRLDDPRAYAECVEKSYPCLDQSFVCSGDNTWYKVDTEDGCNCTYPPERAFYNDISFLCSDIDECEDSSICENSNCTNMIGSYSCDCHEGFVNLNETFCNDVNECEVDNGGCEHNCSNSIGSFNCSCFLGYMGDGLGSCTDVNECEVMNGGCEHNCINSIGSFNCSCFLGYMGDGLGGCTDVNECEVRNGGCDHNCSNTIGSFECSCFEGFNISTTNSSACEFIDIVTMNPQILNFGETEFILVVYGVVVFVLLILLVLIVVLLLFCFCKRRLSHIPKQAPGYNPTIAELDKMKVGDSTVIENPLSESGGSSLEPLKDAKVFPQV